MAGPLSSLSILHHGWQEGEGQEREKMGDGGRIRREWTHLRYSHLGYREHPFISSGDRREVGIRVKYFLYLYQNNIVILFRIATGMVVMVYHLWINKGDLMRYHETEGEGGWMDKDGEVVVVR